MRSGLFVAAHWAPYVVLTASLVALAYVATQRMAAASLNRSAARLDPADVRQIDIVAVTDLDLKSRQEAQGRWHANVLLGSLRRASSNEPFSFRQEDHFPVYSFHAHKNRGMELSELVRWNDRLYAVCDSTGIVFELDLTSRTVLPRYLILDGDGTTSTKPCKLEWAAVKDGDLYLGSIGKEWVVGGEVAHRHPMFVHRIRAGSERIEHLDWSSLYERLRAAANATFPGYLIHEAALWLDDRQQWLFLPRKVSADTPYAEDTDEVLGGNLALLADEAGGPVQVRRLGPLQPEHGFSSVARVPSTDLFVALKVRERAVGDIAETYVGVFDLDGRFYTDPPWLHIADEKLEGVEVLAAGPRPPTAAPPP